MKKLRVYALLLLPFLSLALATESYACQCAAKASVLDEFEQSDDVFAPVPSLASQPSRTFTFEAASCVLVALAEALVAWR